MSEDTDIASEAPRDMRSFEAWVDGARPRAQLWRTLVGIVIIGIVWAGWTLLVMMAYAVVAVAVWRQDPQTVTEQLSKGSTPVILLVMLSTFIGMWLGVALALRLLHKGQKVESLFSAAGRIRWLDFIIGVAIIAGYALISMGVYQLAGMTDGAFRNEISITQWLIFLAPMTVMLFLQSSGEELVFRGYIMQHLAGRFSHPLVWGLLPALAFGFLHWANGSFAEYSIYYVAVTVLFGLVAAVTVWRTGSISAAMGMHTANNFLGFMVAGTDDSMTGTALYLTPVKEIMRGAPYDVAMMVLMLAFVLSPLAPFPKRQLFARRKDTRAAP
jgi:membrane protease YdiL (CAAX protease family)